MKHYYSPLELIIVVVTIIFVLIILAPGYEIDKYEKKIATLSDHYELINSKHNWDLILEAEGDTIDEYNRLINGEIGLVGTKVLRKILKEKGNDSLPDPDEIGKVLLPVATEKSLEKLIELEVKE